MKSEVNNCRFGRRGKTAGKRGEEIRERICPSSTIKKTLRNLKSRKEEKTQELGGGGRAIKECLPSVKTGKKKEEPASTLCRFPISEKERERGVDKESTKTDREKANRLAQKSGRVELVAISWVKNRKITMKNRKSDSQTDLTRQEKKIPRGQGPRLCPPRRIYVRGKRSKGRLVKDPAQEGDKTWLISAFG